jgi:DNA-binding NarL/FixJ family response regulator
MTNESLSYPERPSDRELEVLQLYANGIKRVDAARYMGIVETTVTSHLQNALVKLDARNRVEAVAIAIRKGWIR